MARTKQTARKSTGGKPPRKQLQIYCGGPARVRVILPVASECSQEPKTEDAKEVSKESIVLPIKGVSDFMENAGNTKTSASVSVGGIHWQFRVTTSATGYGGSVQLGCSLEGAHANGAWIRWLTADFFVWDHKDWRKLGGVCEELVGTAPLPCSAGKPNLISALNMRDSWYSYIDKYGDSATFRVDFACWKDSFQEKRPFDDVTFIVEGRPVYANKGYLAYISPVLRAMLTGNFKEGQADQVPIKQTSAEDFVTFMHVNVQALYGMADVYDVEFLRRDCEKHLMATKGIEAIAKVLLAQSLHKTDFIVRTAHNGIATHATFQAQLVGSLSRADLKKIQNDKRKDQLSAEVNDQLREREKLFS